MGFYCNTESLKGLVSGNHRPLKVSLFVASQQLDMLELHSVGMKESVDAGRNRMFSKR